MNFFKDVKEGFRLFGEVIATLINSILLLIVYLIGVGFSYLIIKLSGRQLLRKKVDKNIKSYWIDLNLKKEEMEDYYRQF